MYQVIARKYRPQSFEELIGQEHIRQTLENAIALGRVAHGYIFAGQRGTGKTTVARILARCLNCAEGPSKAPCGSCASCLEIAASNSVDVIEIDAASNRGINEMRELRENIRYRPARDRFKVFIIDEAHQITNEAFNALLKTLEEPPEWVVFMLCTTEAHKIPATIISRCQQFSFRSVEFNAIIGRMEWICEQEGIQAEAEVLESLAQYGDGSVRDSLSALDQAIACCGASLQAQEVRRLLGQFSLETLEQVTAALLDANSQSMLEMVHELERNGQNLQHFCRELARYFRNLLVARIAGAESRLIAASPAQRQRLSETAAAFSEEDLTRYLQITLDLYRELQFSLQPRLHLEIGLLRMVHAGRLVSIEEALSSLPAAASPPAPKPARAAAPQTTTAAKPSAAAPSGSWKQRLHAALTEQGMTFIADAVESAEIAETAGELQIAAPREYSLALGSKDLLIVVERLAGRPLKVKFIASQGEAALAPPQEKAKARDEATQRALSHPEVQRFQELFPGSQVRAVRDLKE